VPTVPPLETPNQKLADALKQLPAAKHGRPNATVEAEIFKRRASTEPPKPALGSTPGGMPQLPGRGPAPAYGATSPRPAGAGGSFLDYWLAKRRTTGPVGAPGAAGMPVAAGAASYPNRPLNASVGPVQPSQSYHSSTNTPVPPKPLVNMQAASPQIQYAPAKQSSPSMSRFDQEEVNHIADKLRSSLNPNGNAQKTQGEISLRQGSKPNDTSPEDTIMIDQEGNLHHKDETAEEASASS